MKKVSYLRLCRYINMVKRTQESEQRARLLIELTAYINWSVEHEEIDNIPISEECLGKTLGYLASQNVKFEDTSSKNKLSDVKFIKSYLISGNLPYDAFDSFIAITAQYSEKTESKLREQIKKSFNTEEIVKLSEIIAYDVYPEYQKVETKVSKKTKTIKVDLYFSIFSMSPCGDEANKIKGGIENITGYKADVDYHIEG